MADCSSTDSDDDEYIPNELAASSCSPSDDSEGEAEAGVVVPSKRNQGKSKQRIRRKKPKGQLPSRKKHGRIQLEDRADEGGDIVDEGGDIVDEDTSVTDELKNDEQYCSRIDDLWASFKQDVERKITSRGTESVTNDIEASTNMAAGTGQEGPVDTQSKSVTIKKTYDFAGEEIEVEKQVAADSKEGIKFLKSQSEKSTAPETTTLTESPLIRGVPMAIHTPPFDNTGVKRKGAGLNSILQSIGKKQKLSTLEKSKLDWQKFKTDAGLHDELAHSTQDGYLAKQEFLQRANVRQFELEKEQRLKRLKRLN